MHRNTTTQTSTTFIFSHSFQIKILDFRQKYNFKIIHPISKSFMDELFYNGKKQIKLSDI